jgi:hypothetical protein
MRGWEATLQAVTEGTLLDDSGAGAPENASTLVTISAHVPRFRIGMAGLTRKRKRYMGRLAAQWKIPKSKLKMLAKSKRPIAF